MLSRNLLQGIINHYMSNAMAHVHAICNFHILMIVSTKEPIKSLLDLVYVYKQSTFPKGSTLVIPTKHYTL